ncbi:hypothetical protein B0A55_00133 [Friedmanniomyces simplex]|uniref:AB hydrolase-1 domain-containing protein n=1 Tax=Friedmanniomyces simplex TaxID=329884 RepID=A0A4U0Y5G9_9PEZI|nr:hypothetical protein B0A55_00133 [Friedmanniomyces simplex]
MKTYLASRPTTFDTLDEAIQWHLRSRTLRNPESAHASVPALFLPTPSGKFVWRTDLAATAPYWDQWFAGMSRKFLAGRGAKELILAGTDRLDRELMIGQMQGKFQLVVVPEAGHFVQEDVPGKTAGLLVEFFRRNDRGAMVLPPKVSELLAQGKKNQKRHACVLALPPPEKLREIAAKQEARAKELKAKRALQQQQQQQVSRGQSGEQALAAAEVIQRNYRGYRDRRALDGLGLDPSTRWIENVTSPRSRAERKSLSPGGGSGISTRERWRKVGVIAQRAGSDDTSESDSECEAQTDEQRRRMREQRRARKAEREKIARVMGLEYFLEMVDQKHRYGSNLRRYHQEWKKSTTQENFFYWLDYGEGQTMDLEDRPRTRLDTEQVRYLSREDRVNYLVQIDQQGRFCWAKNGKPITTSPEFRDSINGIVPVHDATPTWREVTTGVAPDPDLTHSSDGDSEASSTISTGSQARSSKYPNHDLHAATGPSKPKHLTPDSLKTHRLRKPTKKPTWIWVANTSSRLYLGIKQPGAFQHSSFLHGARVSAAGLAKIKHGELRKLSPLSGHYAPPLKNFREFVRSLQEAGADLSRCSLARSYAVLVGLDGWLGAKRGAEGVGRRVRELVDPEVRRRREEGERDGCLSARREREVLRRVGEDEDRKGLSGRVRRGLHLEEMEKEKGKGKGKEKEKGKEVKPGG